MTLYCRKCDDNHEIPAGDVERIVYNLAVTPYVNPCLKDVLTDSFMNGKGCVIGTHIQNRRRIASWSPAVLNQEFEPIPEELPQVGELMGHNPGTGVPDPWLGAVCTSCGKHTGAFMGSIDGKLNCYECFVKDIPAPIGVTKNRRCKDCSKELIGGASVMYGNAEHCMDCYSKIAEETLCQ